MSVVGVLYSCIACGLSDVRCEVRERGETEDVVAWMRGAATVALARDHSRRSPACRAVTLSEVKIPITGVERVGDAVRH